MSYKWTILDVYIEVSFVQDLHQKTSTLFSLNLSIRKTIDLDIKNDSASLFKGNLLL